MAVELSPAEVSRVFPFLLACDEELRIVEVGRSLARLLPNLLLGQALSDVARVLRPADGLSVGRLQDDGSTAVLLELTDPLVVLHGQALIRPGGVLLLVSPWVTDTAQLERLGLNLADFPDHDPMAEYLRLFQAKNAALREATALGVRLRQASQAAQSALEQREVVTARLEALLRRLRLGVLVEDEHGQIVLTNERYLELFGLPGTPSELAGVDRMVAAAGTSVRFADPEAFVAGLEARTRAREPVVAEELILSDGRTLERDYVPIFDAHTYRGQMWQYRDVTEQRRAAMQLSAARERAEVANATKSRFLAMMSHEIRTPLGAIVGLSDLLQGTPSEAEQRDLVVRLSRNAKSLIDLLEDILDFAKIEAGEVHVYRTLFEPRNVVREALDALGARAAEKGLALRVEIDSRLPSHLAGDATRVRQVVINLLSNAIKFTSKGSVVIKVSSSSIVANSVLVTYEVTDTGRGIAREAQERIFERFVRVTQVEGDHVPGTGLGLSIVRGLITLMSGTIEVQSALGKGSTFRVVIPHEVATPEEVRRSKPAPKPVVSAERAAHLLLLEDDPDNRAVIRALLEQGGHRVEVAANGQAGLEKAMRFPYDLILTDLQMPVMDGITFVKHLRAHEQQGTTPRTPVVAITAHAISTFRDRAIAAGMDDFAAKPLTAQILAGLVDSWADLRPLIVAVDDAEDHLLLLQRTVGRSASVRLVTLDNAEALFDLADRRAIDLVLLDMNMPGMSGYEAAQRLRARSDTRAVPIVALTAHSAEDEARRCHEVGCNTHLVKPARPRVLELVIDKLLAGHPRATVTRGARSAANLADVAPGYVVRRRIDMESILTDLQRPTPEALQHAARLAHNAKGSGGAYGLPWLSEDAGQLEAALLRGDLEQSRSLAHHVWTRLRDLVTAQSQT